MRTTCAYLALSATIAACLAGTGCAKHTASGATPRHLILVTVDTYRGDHLLSERGGVPLTPEIARLALESVVFTEALSVSNCTSPGTAGILTGLWPHRSGVNANVHQLSEALPTLADVLSEAGFRTAGFVSNPVLRPGTGFEQGFDVYERIKSDEAPRAAAARNLAPHA